MSKLFYDHLTKLKKVEKEIKKVAESEEERYELWKIVDEIVHHRILGCIFDHLPEKHHDSFLQEFHARPHDEGLIKYLSDRIKKDVTLLVKYEAKKIEHEILEYFMEGEKSKLITSKKAKSK